MPLLSIFCSSDVSQVTLLFQSSIRIRHIYQNHGGVHLHPGLLFGECASIVSKKLFENAGPFADFFELIMHLPDEKERG